MGRACRACVCLLTVAGVFVVACSGSPSGPSGSLKTPTADSPADQAAVNSYRPTLVVRNGSVTAAATRSYEFQISDRSDFSSTNNTGAFAVSLRGTAPEGTNGTTSYIPDVDLQPTTRLYWRARTRD